MARDELQPQKISFRDLLQTNKSISSAASAFAVVEKENIRELPANGILYDATSQPVPDYVVEAAIQVSQLSQETFLTWIGPHMSGRQPVTILPEDRQSHTDINFDYLLACMRNYRNGLLCSSVTLPARAAETLSQIRAIEATYHLMDAVVLKETDGVAETLGVAALAGFAAHALEQRGMSPAVYAVASSLDNTLSMIAEYRKLHRQGHSEQKALTALVPSALALIGSWFVATQVHASFEAHRQVQAGILFGGGSGICIMPALGAALFPLGKEYDTLVLDGKIDDPVQLSLLETENPTLTQKLRAFVRRSQKALVHDLIYPHHAGMYIGALAGIGLSAIAASVPSDGGYLLQWPPVLSLLGIMDSVGGMVGGKATHVIYDIARRRALRQLVDERKVDAHKAS